MYNLYLGLLETVRFILDVLYTTSMEWLQLNLVSKINQKSSC